MAKPTTLPRWSDVAPGTTTIEPTSGEKDAGFTNATPGSKKVNWLFYWLSRWASYVDTLVGEALTWTALQTFSAGISVTTLNATNLNASNDVTATDDVTAGDDVVAGGDVTATAGSIVATAGNVQAGAKLTAGTNCEVVANVLAGGFVQGATVKFSTVRRRWSRDFTVEDATAWTPVPGASRITMQLHVDNGSVLYCQIPVQEGDRIVNWLIEWENADSTVDGRAIISGDTGGGETITLAHGTTKTITTRSAVNFDVTSAGGWSVLIDAPGGVATADTIKIYRVGVDVMIP